jgi:hypothetical protein
LIVVAQAGSSPFYSLPILLLADFLRRMNSWGASLRKHYCIVPALLILAGATIGNGYEDRTKAVTGRETRKSMVSEIRQTKRNCANFSSV